MDLSTLKWDAKGLVAVVVQDRCNGEVRMLGYANREAVEKTLSTGLAHFYSRSRSSLWCKGETSGNTLQVSGVFADCDGDALVYLADPNGPTCHTGQETCFFRQVAEGGVQDAVPARPVMSALWQTLEARRDADAVKSYTRMLLTKGSAKIAEKVSEEAEEFGRALQSETPDRVVSEGADVLYHVLVGLLARGVSLRDVEQELARRFVMSGLEEKASRKADGSH